MAISINGSSNVITGLSQGGLPDGCVTNADIDGMAASKLTGALPAISGASLTNIPEAEISGKLDSSSHIQQTVASGLTYNSVTGDQSLGSVSNATASSIKALVCFVQCVHSSSSASHGYLTGWIYQTGKTYNVDGGYFDVRTYNQYVLHFPTTVIIPWDPSGTQSLNLYINSSTETGTNNYFNVGVDSLLRNV
jgi:hypothetical protein|tara:strand:- start:150 stop:728 length:579 start_codon:yes stop_codon:yes gene_type:complete